MVLPVFRQDPSCSHSYTPPKIKLKIDLQVRFISFSGWFFQVNQLFSTSGVYPTMWWEVLDRFFDFQTTEGRIPPMNYHETYELLEGSSQDL